MRSKLAIGIAIGVALAGIWWQQRPASGWSDSELALLRSLHIEQLPPLPPDPSNAVADNPDAARFGHLLFFDTRLSRNGAVACATCHDPAKRFTDGLPQAEALGRSARNTMSLVGASYSPWYYWDGRKDSQWSQALAPLEDPAEQGSNRMQLARLVAQDEQYRAMYEGLFGALPDFSDSSRFPEHAAPSADEALNAAWQHMGAADRHEVERVFANIGKALAAYQRKLVPGPSRFDAYVASLYGSAAKTDVQFSADEAAGLRLFIGEGRCVECHNGPLFTNNEFHNTGLLPVAGAVPDQGRSRALELLRADPFNCIGKFSDVDAGQCSEFRFMRSGPELVGAMRTPSLRNLGGTAPYMHKGQLPDLASVLRHYNDAPLALIGHNEAEPLGLSARELRQLEAFLLTLDAPLATEPQWLEAPAKP